MFGVAKVVKKGGYGGEVGSVSIFLKGNYCKNRFKGFDVDEMCL